MNRIDLVTRAVTAVMLASVTALTIIAAISLERSGAAGAHVSREYRWHQVFERLGGAFEAERLSLDRSFFAPTPMDERAAGPASARFVTLLEQAKRGADTPATRAQIARIADLHARTAVVLDRVRRLQLAGDLDAALNTYASSFLPAYAQLATYLDTAAQERFAKALAMGAHLQHSVFVLGTWLFGAGLLNLAVLGGLLYAAHSYKMKALQAMEHEMHRLAEAAHLDSLTGVGNHRAFYDDITREIARSRRQGHSLTLALIDVDDFKELNDTRGHQRGDDVLVQLARTLRAGRHEDRSYRVGGDEFALILPDTDAAHAAVALERVRSAVQSSLGGVTVSVGYCELDRSANERELYNRADSALYEAKRRGRNACVDFAVVNAGEATVFPSQKVTALRSLIAQRALDIAFQPIWDLHSGRPMGFEALARPRAETGFTGPQEMFDVAERSRRTTELDCLCLEEIVASVSWLPSDALLFVNVTPESLENMAFKSDRYLHGLQSAGLRPGRVVVEITERKIGDIGRLVSRLNTLHERGVLIALDDTGSGSAGLEILGAFRFDFVKIDGKIVQRACVEPHARAIIAGIATIAHESGAYLIAEGIESGEQLDYVRGYGAAIPSVLAIQGAQGYALGRPTVGEPSLPALAS